MASADFTDPYIDPETGILRNKVGARSQRDLDAAEADFTAVRAYQLIFTNPIKPTGDLDELRAIHRHLFQDVYQWAGTLRTVDISKKLGPDEATEFFLPHSMLGRGMGFAADDLAALFETAQHGIGNDVTVDPHGSTTPRTAAGVFPVLALRGIKLALSPPPPGVRACDGCGWFFIDTSRGRRRRWCSMKTCGNQTKAARYRATHP